MFKKKLSQKGFTLIELLVVIAIIGILSSVVLVSLQSSRAKARDAKRIADIGSIQQALALYYDSNQAYPVAIVTLATGGLLSAEPKDPTTNASYSYAVSKNGLSYHLGASLEQVAAGTGVLLSDKDCHSDAGPHGSELACFSDGAANSGGFDGVDPMYDVTP